MLVGREAEIALLSDRIEQGRSVAVLGEAGVGKTSLVRTAVERTGKPMLEAGALATLAWLPYLPLRRALGRDLGEGDVAYVAAEVERAAAGAVLFVDDLHWADRQTRSLLPLLAGRVPLVAAVRRGDPGTADVLSELGEAEFEVVPLEPLDAPDGVLLAQRLDSRLTESSARVLVEQAGGNPFLIEQLVEHGEPTESLRLMLAARIRALAPAARDALATLALLGRPSSPQLLGDAIEEAVEAGLVRANGEYAIRHALLAEAVVAQLEGERRRALHTQLGEALSDPGEAARHHAAAGEREQAVAKALVAARSASSTERAAHLELAALNADGPRAATLRLDAADALIDEREHPRAVTLIESLADVPDIDLPRLRLIEGRVRWNTGDPDGALAALRSGLAAIGDDRSAAAVLLGMELARRIQDVESNAEQAAAHARRALEIAEELGEHVARAKFNYGAVLAHAGRDDAHEHLEAALVDARRAGEIETEFLIAGVLGIDCARRGDSARREQLALESVERARALNRRGWERDARATLVDIWLDQGKLHAAVEEADALLAEALPSRDRDDVVSLLALGLVDLGRIDEAISLVERYLPQAPPDVAGRGNLLFIRAEAEFWGGRPRDALATVNERLQIRQGEWFVHAFARVTEARSSVELGRTPPPPVGEFLEPIAAAVREIEALRALSATDFVGAAAAFADAASSWAANSRRGELRCRWGEGDSRRRAGELDEARAVLIDVERRALELGFRPLAARIQRSLRLAGERRSAPRERDGVLTVREREVLELVAAGLSNAEIARRLGLGRPTVVREIRSAQAKLGATSRAQAAALAQTARE